MREREITGHEKLQKDTRQPDKQTAPEKQKKKKKKKKKEEEEEKRKEKEKQGGIIGKK